MHPTAQYGQTPECTFASLILSVAAAAATGLRSIAAVLAAAPADPAYLRKSRLERLMRTPRCVRMRSGSELARRRRVGDGSSDRCDEGQTPTRESSGESWQDDKDVVRPLSSG